MTSACVNCKTAAVVILIFKKEKENAFRFTEFHLRTKKKYNARIYNETLCLYIFIYFFFYNYFKQNHSMIFINRTRALLIFVVLVQQLQAKKKSI